MRNTHSVTVFLAATLGACSGGQGSGDGAALNSPPPPVQSPDPGPPPPPALPPLETLTCSPCKKIVFVSARDGNDEIYSVNVDGTEVTRLTDNGARDEDPAWSPDGRRIAFTSDRDSDGSGIPADQGEVYVMDADGSNVQRLTFLKSGARGPAWSPDGTQIVYETPIGDSLNLFEVSVDGGTPRLLFSTPGLDEQPAWSPDGSRLAVVSDWFAYDFVTDVFLVNADGSGFTTLTDGNIFDQVDYEDPAWSPDGGKVAMTVLKRHNTWDYATGIGVVNANGSDLTILPTPDSLSTPDVGASTPSWSPDGTMIAYSYCTTGAGCRVSWIKADGSARGEIVGDGWNPDWQR